jgi:hypothetical protein
LALANEIARLLELCLLVGSGATPLTSTLLDFDIWTLSLLTAGNPPASSKSKIENQKFPPEGKARRSTHTQLTLECGVSGREADRRTLQDGNLEDGSSRFLNT